MKKCPMCLKSEPDILFGSNRARSDGKDTYCKKCTKLRRITPKDELPLVIESVREGREPKPILGKTEVLRRIKETNVTYVNNYKKECSLCGYSKCKRALHFHHRQKSQKTMSISMMISANYSLSRIQEEIDKCDVICANCHAEIHESEV